MATDLSTRERLVDAAIRLMPARGYEAVGVAELCGAADVRRGSFYYHFDSKEDLALAMVDRSWRESRETIFEPAFGDSSRPVAERFQAYTELLVTIHRRRRQEADHVHGCRLGNLAIELSTTHPAIQGKVRSCLDEMTGYFERALQDGIDRGEIRPDLDVADVAQAICAHMEGLVMLAKVRNDPDVIARLADHAMRLTQA
jgi:TetR/AcrR family transcriptional repressor of nem operon